MKARTHRHFSKLIAVVGFSFVQATLISQSSAAIYTNTASSTTQWAAGSSWDVAPASASATTLTFGGGTALAAGVTITANNDIAGNFQLNKLEQTYAGPGSGTAPTLTISGSPLEFVTNGSTTPTISIGPTGTVRTTTNLNNNLILTNNLRIAQGNPNQLATLNGALSGAGNLNKGGTGNVTLSNVNSSFTGAVVIESGSFTVTSIGNAGSNSPLGTNGGITLGSGGNAGQLTWTGSSETTDKVFTLSGSTGGGTISASTSSQTLTITPDIVGGANAAVRTLTLTGNGNVNLSGSIGVGSSLTLSLAKSGAGTATLTGTNGSFNGPVTVSQGTLAATSIGNSGSNSSIGTNATINLGGIANTGTLRFLGTVDEATDKVINLSGTTGGATITTRDAVLTISADLTMSGTGAKSFTLSSSTGTSGVNFNGLLADINGALSLRVNGSGTGNNSFGNTSNSFSGSVTIDGNIIAKTTTLQVASVGNSGSNSSLGTNGTIHLGSATAASNNILKYFGSGEISNKVINLAGSLGNGGLDQSSTSGLLKFTSDLTATGLGNKTFILQGSTDGIGEFAGKIVDSIGFATSLGKYGAGTWILSGANTYTGATNVAAGTLALGVSASIHTSSGVTLGSGATLDTTAQPTFTIPSGKTYIIGLNSTADGTSGQIKAANLDIANATIDFTPAIPPLDDAAYVIATYSGTLTGTFGLAAPTGYSWDYGTGTNSQITLVQDAAGYTSWKIDNAGGQDPSLDWDEDGISNGVEFFMNAPSGFTSNPALAAGVISWTNGGNIDIAAYGTQYVVQTSDDLVIWADVPAGELTSNSAGPDGSLTYTLNGPGKRFVRLKVSPKL
jgi:autotransporter-associated beta strand protein